MLWPVGSDPSHYPLAGCSLPPGGAGATLLSTLCSLHSWNTVKTVTFSEDPWGWGLLALGRSLTVTRARAAFPGRESRAPGRNLGVAIPREGRQLQV